MSSVLGPSALSLPQWLASCSIISQGIILASVLDDVSNLQVGYG